MCLAQGHNAVTLYSGSLPNGVVAFADPEGGRGSGLPPLPSPEKSQNIGFLSHTGPDPLKIIKILSQYSMLGHYCFAGGPKMARL